MFESHSALVASAVSSGPELPSLHLQCQTLHRTAHSSLDIIEHAPGAYDWRFDAHLSGCVLSGAATIGMPDGTEIHLGPGKAFFLPCGLLAHWVVVEPLRTAAVWDR